MERIRVSSKISANLSSRIRNLSFLLVVQVVFIHAYYQVWHENPSGLNKLNFFIQYLVSQELCRIAVPLFFIISGYLFFADCTADLGWFIVKWKRRIKTLLIPYLLWSIIGLISYFVMQNTSWATRFFTRKLLKDYTIFELIATLLWSPVPYQLWFLRYLILYVLLTPLIYLICKKCDGVLVFLLVFSSLVLVPIFIYYRLFDFFLLGPVLHFFGFFLLGSYLSINGDCSRYDSREAPCWHSCLAWVALCLTDSYLEVIHNIRILGLHEFAIFLGIYCAWILSDRIQRYTSRVRLVALSSYSFFLFASHEPLLTIVKKGGNFLVGEQSTFMFMLLYFLCPLTTIFLSISSAVLLNRYLPKVFIQLTGHR